MWLKCEVVDTDKNGKKVTSRSDNGTPQGGVISPLLSNVYLHWFERAFHAPNGPATWAKAKIVRYADDFVILARYQGIQLQRWIEQTLEGRFRLTINRDKTKIVKLNAIGSTLDFLGYTFRYDRDLEGRPHRYLNIVPSRKALAKARDAIRDLTSPSQCFKPTTVMISEINRWSTGWVNYFGYGYPRSLPSDPQLYRGATDEPPTASKSASLPPPEGKTFYAHVHDLGLRRL